MDWDNPVGPPSRMACRDPPSAAARAWHRWPQHRAAVDQHRRLPEAAALRPWRHRPGRLSGLSARAAAATATARCASMPAMRRSSISVPAATRPKSNARAANGTCWQTPSQRSAANRFMRLIAPCAALGAVAHQRGQPEPAAGIGGLPGAGEEAAQIQSVALGRDRPRRSGHQRRLRTHLSRHGGPRPRPTRTGKSFAICGPAISAPTSPKNAGPALSRA